MRLTPRGTRTSELRWIRQREEPQRRWYEGLEPASGQGPVRYALLLLGGLARVKRMGNLALEEGTPVTRGITETLELCEAQGIWDKARMKQLGGIAGEVLAIYRGEEADPSLLYRMI